jgi:type IX secretion system PorP/SprF family membrane protein
MRGKLLILLLFISGISLSQDIHFSQNFADRMYFNPALVGNIAEQDYRVSIQRKSQWNSVTVPFSTFSTSFEYKDFYKGLNLGLQFLNDKSGDSKLTLNQLNMAISKNYKVLKVNSFSIGGIVGFGQKTIDYSALIFEEEENFVSDNFLFPDIGIGLDYRTNPYEILSYNVGLSIYHINQANMSFNEDENVKLSIKNNVNLGVSYKYSEMIKVNSELIITNQWRQKEILIGVRPEIKLDKITLFPLAYYRINDAAIFGFGLEKENIQCNISYDINTSDLTTASNNKGGFEFSVIYIWKKKKKEITNYKDKKCPKYL